MTDEPSGPRSQGTSATYILGRLRDEGRFDLVDAVETGRLSAFAAGEAAGYVRRPEVLGTGSVNQRRKRQHQLRSLAGDGTLSKLQELWLGPHPTTGSLFNSREELVQAWQEHRDEIMRQWGSHGRRPMAWWEFEAGELEHPGYDRERSCLYEHNVLTAAERAELEVTWREAFDRARGKSAKERREAYEFADIPNELIERWQGARRRRSKLPKGEDVVLIPQPGSPSG